MEATTEPSRSVKKQRKNFFVLFINKINNNKFGQRPK